MFMLFKRYLNFVVSDAWAGWFLTISGKILTLTLEILHRLVVLKIMKVPYSFYFYRSMCSGLCL